MAKNKIIWTGQAIHQFKSSIDHIAGNSLQNALSVQERILLKIEQVAQHPMSCPQDKDKEINDGTYRRLLILKHYIVYKVGPGSITILRIRHTSRLPKQY